MEQCVTVRGIEYEFSFQCDSDFLYKEFVNGKNKLSFEIIFPEQISDILGYSSGGINQLNIRIVDKENRIYSTRTGFGGSHLIDEDIEKCISLQDKIQVNLYLKNRILKTMKLENASSKSSEIL